MNRFSEAIRDGHDAFKIDKTSSVKVSYRLACALTGARMHRNALEVLLNVPSSSFECNTTVEDNANATKKAGVGGNNNNSNSKGNMRKIFFKKNGIFFLISFGC